MRRSLGILISQLVLIKLKISNPRFFISFKVQLLLRAMVRSSMLPFLKQTLPCSFLSLKEALLSLSFFLRLIITRLPIEFLILFI